MTDLPGALIGAIAATSIPLVAWLSRRMTREGRLLVRVDRLGSAYALMPPSAEKDEFALHLNASVKELNAWLDPDSAKRRKLVRTISAWVYVAGIVSLFLALPLVEAQGSWVSSSALGAIIGSAIAIVSALSSYVLERRSREEAAVASKAVEQAAAQLRMEALRLGEPIRPADR